MRRVAALLTCLLIANVASCSLFDPRQGSDAGVFIDKEEFFAKFAEGSVVESAIVHEEEMADAIREDYARAVRVIQTSPPGTSRSQFVSTLHKYGFPTPMSISTFRHEFLYLTDNVRIRVVWTYRNADRGKETIFEHKDIQILVGNSWATVLPSMGTRRPRGSENISVFSA